MNAEQLLARYERVAEAPDAMARLRQFILDLAVRGRLVVQNHNDEPAAQLISRLLNEKETLGSSGGLKRRKAKELLHDQPYLVPDGWKWSTLGDLATKLTDGSHNPPADAGTGFPMLSSQNVLDGSIDFTGRARFLTELDFARENSRTKVTAGDVLLTIVGTIGRSAVVPPGSPPFALQRSVAVISTGLVPHFLSLQLRAPVVTSFLTEHGKGTAQKGIYLGKLSSLPVAVPPLAEQHRIVAKVDELMALCDRLEAARSQREATRNRLTAATLSRLNTPEPPASPDGDASKESSFQSDARFALKVLPSLAARPDQIKQLRQTILTLAVRGKLTQQQDEEGSGQELLSRITAGRIDAAKAAAVRLKMTRSVDDTDVLGSLPSSWAVEQLGNLVHPAYTISYGVLVPGPDVDDGIPFVRAQDLALSGHPERPRKTIAPDIEAPYARTRLRGGEILLCVVGSIGKLGVAPVSWAGANIARAVARISPFEGVCRDYLLIALQSDLMQRQFLDATRTVAQPTLNVSLIESLPVPVPPLAEQHRIVAKVNELMALCDQLEASLIRGENIRSRLLDALLHEALAPTEPELEPA